MLLLLAARLSTTQRLAPLLAQPLDDAALHARGAEPLLLLVHVLARRVGGTPRPRSTWFAAASTVMPRLRSVPAVATLARARCDLLRGAQSSRAAAGSSASLRSCSSRIARASSCARWRSTLERRAGAARSSRKMKRLHDVAPPEVRSAHRGELRRAAHRTSSRLVWSLRVLAQERTGSGDASRSRRRPADRRRSCRRRPRSGPRARGRRPRAAGSGSARLAVLADDHLVAHAAHALEHVDRREVLARSPAGATARCGRRGSSAPRRRPAR